MQDLVVYKTLPRWNKSTFPQLFLEIQPALSATWTQLLIFQGTLTVQIFDEEGTLLQTELLSSEESTIISPQQRYKFVTLSDDIDCQVLLLCRDEAYFTQKYQLTATHRDVIAALKSVPIGKVLDLGCGNGRNSLYLARKGFAVTALDKNPNAINTLTHIINEERLTNITASVYNIESAALTQQYDFIVSTVVMMFLQPDSIANVIENMQTSTAIGGYNLIVCAMSTDDCPCSMPFPFTFKTGELRNYYRDWDMITYNEDMGELHRTDQNGQRIKLRFATMLAKKRTE